MPTTGKALTIVFIYNAVFVLLLAFWAATITAMALWGLPKAVLLMGVLWLLAPFTLSLALPVIAPLIALAASDPDSATKAEAPINLSKGLWAAGLIYALLLAKGHWHGQGSILVVFLLCVASLWATTMFKAPAPAPAKKEGKK